MLVRKRPYPDGLLSEGLPVPRGFRRLELAGRIRGATLRTRRLLGVHFQGALHHGGCAEVDRRSDHREGIPLAGRSGEDRCHECHDLEDPVPAHNTALSDLDQIGIRFFEKLRAARFERPSSDTVACSQISLFRGEMIELWMLKVLCGLIVSGNAPDRSGPSINTALPDAWLGFLFGHQPLPAGWGVYMPGAVGNGFGGSQPNGITVIYENGVLNGFIMVLDHLGFVLVMNQPPVVKTGTLLDGCTYRPGVIVVNSRLRQDILGSLWERFGDERSITIG